MGVGMLESWRGTGANWGLFARTFLGWVVTFVFSGIVSAVLFSLGELFTEWGHLVAFLPCMLFGSVCWAVSVMDRQAVAELSNTVSICTSVHALISRAWSASWFKRSHTINMQWLLPRQ